MSKETAITSRPLMQEMFASGLYKPNQGRMVRQITCLVIWVLVVATAWRWHTLFIAPWFANAMGESGIAPGYIAAVALGGLGMWFGYRLVNWPKFADFLISVEAELNKVSWPTQKELVRASLVVIFTMLFLSAVLFGYDWFWDTLFTWLRIR